MRSKPIPVLFLEKREAAAGLRLAFSRWLASGQDARKVPLRETTGVIHLIPAEVHRCLTDLVRRRVVVVVVFNWMSCASSAGNVIRPKNKLKKFSHWGSGERVIPHSWCCVHSVSCSHREQSLAYKRRIPQADSRPNPHRARFKLKGHSLVFSRPCYVCVCAVTHSSTSVSAYVWELWLYPS